MTKSKKKTLCAIILAISLVGSVAGCGKVKDLTTNERQRTTAETSTDTDMTTEVIVTTEDTGDTLLDYPDSAEALEEQAEFEEYLKESFEESVVCDTITLHYTLADPEGYGITPPEPTLGEEDSDLSEEGIEKSRQETQEELDELECFEYELLTKDQRFIYDILHEYLLTDLLSYDYAYMYEPFAYTSGLQANYPITMAEYKFYDMGDVDDYLKLLELTPDYFQIYLDFERVKSDRGLFMNSNSASEVIRQCSDFIATPEKNVLIETFNTRIETVPGITADEIESYKQMNHDAVLEYIIPTYQNVIDVFTELQDTGVNDLGLAHYENGQDYYKYLLASKVGTDKTPEEAIAAIEDRLEKEMDDLYTVVFADYDGYVSYFDEADNIYTDIDYKETIEYFEKVFDDSFPDIPDIDFTVTPVHESLQDSVSPAFFMTPPLDNYLQNSIYINEGTDSTGSIWSTLCHEGVPGHMYQFVYFLSSNPAPIRTLLSFNGYEEGWATYVEAKAFKYYNGFSNETYADIERINDRLNLLVSARIEIGVNYEGWTLEDTQNYLAEQGFNQEVAQDIIDYVVAEPANYQMYCLGWLEFEELYEYAENALGSSFDEKEFHKVVLDAGPCQFYLLKSKVQDYVNGK
ncbi:MAG: DUF885 domain-containing protein [Wujia sp.]